MYIYVNICTTFRTVLSTDFTVCACVCMHARALAMSLLPLHFTWNAFPIFGKDLWVLLLAEFSEGRTNGGQAEGQTTAPLGLLTCQALAAEEKGLRELRHLPEFATPVHVGAKGGTRVF